MTAPSLPPRLDADGFNAAVGGPASYDRLLELDYELCRLAWLNCAAWDDSTRPFWVLKGGFAIRHTYQSDRLSADVDLAPMGLTARGKGDLNFPPELRLDNKELAKSGKSERWRFSFPHLIGTQRSTVWSDLNIGRPVRLPPPQRRPFTCKFMPDFPVWVASIEEIIGEKSNGLLSFSYGDVDRIKDSFDLWFLLSNRHADKLKKANLTKVLSQLSVTRSVPCPTTGLGAWFSFVLARPEAQVWWNRTVRPLLRGHPRVSFETVQEQLPELAQRYLV